MRIIGILFCLVMLTAVLASAQPKLQIAGPVEYDFGITPQSATVVNYFWFKSVGNDTVRLGEMKTGCDCATMKITNPVLPPGDSMMVGFFWDTQLKIGNSGRYPYIFVDKVADPYRLALKMNVITRPDSAAPLALKPFKIELSRVRATSLDSIGFALTNRRSETLVLKVVSNVPPEFAYSLPDSLPANTTAKGYVKVLPSTVDREFRSSITIEWTTASKETGRITLPVRRKLFG